MPADALVPCVARSTAATKLTVTLQWHHNEHNGVSNHQPHHCLLNRLFRRRSKKTSKLHITGVCEGNSPWPVKSPHKGPVTRKMFPFDDVIMKPGTGCDHSWRESPAVWVMSQSEVNTNIPSYSLKKLCTLMGWHHWSVISIWFI